MTDQTNIMQFAKEAADQYGLKGRCRCTRRKATTMKKAKAPKDPDYRAAWRACKKPWVSWSVVDLRKRLKQLLRSGWSIQALKAYAFVCWRHKRCDHVTEGAWRWAVAFADSSHVLGGRNVLERYKADPGFYAFVK